MRQSSVIDRRPSMDCAWDDGHWSVERVVRLLILVLGGVAVTAALLVTLLFTLLLLPLHLLTGGRSHTLSLRGSLRQIGSQWSGVRRSWR